MKVQQLYYGGRRQDASSGRTFKNTNPATGETICEVQEASSVDVQQCIDAASQGFRAWSAMAPIERGRILAKAASILRDRNRALAELEVMDTGKPISEAIAVDVHSGADALEYYAGIASGIQGDYLDLGNSFVYVRREPLGICAGIGAWNYPLQIACWKSAPALACGNAMIFKPAELTPLTALRLAEIYSEAGLPDGVFNVIQGGAAVGAMLVEHEAIAKVSLTGEVSTGKKVMAAGAKTLKHITLELGGKSPLLVFEDADVEEAVRGAIMANFYTQGEVCSNGTRVYVQEHILPLFIERLVAETRKLRIGNPMDMKTHIGALISADHLQKVLDYIAVGKNQGATLLCGGHRYHPDNGINDGGYFVEPTIFSATGDLDRIVREEIFGPVMTVLGFRDEDEVVGRANDTPFGLAAGVFTKDLQRAHRVVDQLQAGVCWINNYNITPVEVPFGGYKQSGIGRENGRAALEHYTQRKTVYVEMDKIDYPYS